MKYKVIIMLFLSLIFTSTFVVAASAPIDILNEFYQSSIDKDLDKYISIQDPLFLEKQGNYKDYCNKTFDEVDILNYEIVNPEIFEKENSTLIFYELKGTFEIDGSKTDIDNDMVAFLWKYDDWKVRWTITRGLYEQKIAYSMIIDTSIEMLFEEASNTTIKQQMIDEGFDVTNDDETFDDFDDTSVTFWPWILLLILLVILIYFYVKRIKVNKLKVKRQKVEKSKVEESKVEKSKFEESKVEKSKVKQPINGFFVKIINLYERFIVWFKKDGVLTINKGLKYLSHLILKVSKITVHHSKKAYKKVKPHIKQGHEKLKKKINDLKKTNKIEETVQTEETNQPAETKK